MPSVRKVPVFEVDLGRTMGRLRRPLAGTPLSGRGERRISRVAREALKRVLRDVVEDAARDGSLPERTGRARATMVNGARAFGSTFNTLRGHIIGPSYIKRLEEGGTVTPKRTKYLAVPLRAALRPDGTPKLPGPRSWSNVQRTYVFHSKKTNRRYIAMKNSSGKQVILYALVKSVEFQAKGFLAASWEKHKYELMEDIGRALLEEMLRVDLGVLARVTTKSGYSAGARRIMGGAR